MYNSVTVSVLSENTQLTSALEKARGEIRVRQPAELVPKSLYVCLHTAEVYSLLYIHFLNLISYLFSLHSSTIPPQLTLQHLKGQLSVLQMTSPEIRKHRARVQLRDRRRADQ